MGNTRISRGKEIREKVHVISTSHSPQRSYHPLSLTRDRLYHTPMSHLGASRPQRHRVEENLDKNDQMNKKQIKY